MVNGEIWKEFFMSYYDDTVEIIEVKKRIKQRYVDGLKEGLKKFGVNYAHAYEMDKRKYEFERVKLEESNFGEFYDDFKKAYEQGVKEGLKEVELQKAKK